MGQRIRQLREQKSYGQAELARLVGIRPKSLYAIERGIVGPGPATLRKIAAVLDVPIEELTTRDDEREEKHRGSR